MEVIHESVAGLDIRKETVVACVRLADAGRARRECRTFATATEELQALLAWLQAHRCSQVAMEATGVYWMPIWKVLSDGDFTLVVANAAHIKAVPGRKTDMNDATWLADLAAFGLIRARLDAAAERRTGFQALRRNGDGARAAAGAAPAE